MTSIQKRMQSAPGSPVAGWDWDDLRYFLAAYRAGTLSGAAVALGVAQATMSRRIRGLEEAVGHALFDRRREGLEPTEAAVILLPHIEAMEASSTEAEALLSGLEREPEGVVRLAMPPGIAFDLTPSLIERLQREAPKVRLEVLAATHHIDLSRREADLALRSLRPTQADLVFKKLPLAECCAYAAPAYCAKLPPGYGPSDVDWVQYSSSLLHIPLAQWVEQHRGTRPPVFTSDNFLTLREVTRAGFGAMLLPAAQAVPFGLVPLAFEVVLPEVEFFIVTHRALRHIPRIRMVRQALGEAVERLATNPWTAPRH